VEQQRLNQSVQQLTQGVAEFGMLTQVSGKQDGGDPAMMANLQSLLQQAQTQQATGRLVVRVDNSTPWWVLQTT
jgi:hypothetical protein